MQINSFSASKQPMKRKNQALSVSTDKLGELYTEEKPKYIDVDS